MFALVERLLMRADAGCQLWPHEISTATSLIVNTLYFLELNCFERDAAERARTAVIDYANSRCVRELPQLRHRDEGLRVAAHEGLAALRRVTKSAAVNARLQPLCA